MQLDRVTAEIRPRSDLEAVDLGLALVRRDFWRCLAGWWLALAVPVVVWGWLLWDYPVVLLALFWWAKPAGSRMVLMQLSRRLFGEQPGWGTLVREVPQVWRRRFFYRFCWARFSPFLPVTLAVEDLEGVRGKAYQQRAGQLVRRGGGMLTTLYLLADLAAAWFGLAVFGLLGMLVPAGQEAPWSMAWEEWDPEHPLAIPLLLLRTLTGCVMVAISLTDILVAGAGFGLYVNTRTWIEGWDVELAFRRLGQRLGKGVGLFVVLAVGLLAAPQARGQEAGAIGDPHAVITEIKADPDFNVHKVTRKVREMDGFDRVSLPFAGVLAWVAQIAALAGGLWLLGWLLWKYRYVFARDGLPAGAAAAPAARVVMGLAVTPESLPGDIPGAVWGLWQQGRRHEALGLLYRGTISRVIEHGRVPIHEADTEGDCLRRVEEAGEVAFPGYFTGLTRVWIRLAYAGEVPRDDEVAALCHEWPFAGRRPA
jgi:hypothetical protein